MMDPSNSMTAAGGIFSSSPLFFLLGRLNKPSFLPSPPVFESDWTKRDQWPVGDQFIAHHIEGEIYVWGGVQWQPNNDGQPSQLPADVIYVLNIEAMMWRKVAATGDIPRLTNFTASVLMRGIIYIFGGTGAKGQDWNQCTNNIFTLQPTVGQFLLLPVEGNRPSPRYAAKGWSDEGLV